MPTIDQLAPATAASDSDEFLVSQSGKTRKVTRAQVLAGVQPQLAIASGMLLGRASAGLGGPETIRIGANLVLAGGTLTASGTPFNVASLAAGTVPVGTDLVPLGQCGTNTAVTYNQFMNGIAGISNVDVSQLLVTPTGGKTSTKLADLAANTLPLIGGTLTGSLTLARDPATSLQAATKRYVDAQVATTLPKTGGNLSGGLTLAADPTISLHAATKQYVDTQVATAVPKTGGTLTGILTLFADPTGSLQAATKQYTDARVLRSGDTLTGPLVLASDPVAPLHAATRNYVDAQVRDSLPKAGGTLTGALTLATDPATAMQAATKRYVDIQIAAALATTGGPLLLPSYPVAALPSAPGAGAKAFASNGRKPNENDGAGTGVEVFHDGARWISVCSGSPVVA